MVFVKIPHLFHLQLPRCSSSQLILSEGLLTSRLIQRTPTNLRLDSNKWSTSHKLNLNMCAGRLHSYLFSTHWKHSLWRNWGCPLSRLTFDTSDNPKIFKPDGDDVCFRGPVDVEPLETNPVLPLRLDHPVVGLQRVHRLQHRRDSADIWVDLIRWDLSEIVLEERVLPECPPRSRLRDSCTVGFAPGHSTVSDLTFSKT